MIDGSGKVHRLYYSQPRDAELCCLIRSLCFAFYVASKVKSLEIILILTYKAEMTPFETQGLGL